MNARKFIAIDIALTVLSVRYRSNYIEYYMKYVTPSRIEALYDAGFCIVLFLTQSNDQIAEHSTKLCLRILNTTDNRICELYPVTNRPSDRTTTVSRLGDTIHNLAKANNLSIRDSFIVSSDATVLRIGKSIGTHIIQIAQEISTDLYKSVLNLGEALDLATASTDYWPLPEEGEATIHRTMIQSHYSVEACEYDSLYKRRLDRICDELTWKHLYPYIPSQGTVGDIGGGTGNWSARMATIAEQVLLLDVSYDMMKEANRKKHDGDLSNAISLLNADLQALPVASNSLAFCLAEGDVLSYCGDVGCALKELSRVMYRGARLVLSVENLLYRAFVAFRSGSSASDITNLIQTGYVPFYLLEGSVLQSPVTKGFRVRAFTPSSLSETLNMYGFKVELILSKPLFSSLVGYDKLDCIEQFTDSELLELECLLSTFSGAQSLGFHLHAVAVNMKSC